MYDVEASRPLPRLLSEAAAAEYVGLSLEMFRAQVIADVLPQPVPLVSGANPRKLQRRHFYDRIAIDRRIDELSGFDSKPKGSGLADVKWT